MLGKYDVVLLLGTYEIAGRDPARQRAGCQTLHLNPIWLGEISPPMRRARVIDGADRGGHNHWRASRAGLVFYLALPMPARVAESLARDRSFITPYLPETWCGTLYFSVLIIFGLQIMRDYLPLADPTALVGLITRSVDKATTGRLIRTFIVPYRPRHRF